MQFAPAVSELEIRSVQDGIANGVRSDGRALTQRRPFSVTSTRGNDAGYYGGSSVEVHCDGTTIVAAATPSVVELNTDPDSLHNLEKKGVPSLRGPLFVSIDAVPAVVDYYARALRNGTGRYRQAFLSRLALTIRHAFGAEGVTAQEQIGGRGSGVTG
ncbi:hypothetical protein ERJ75_001776800 [Trypanosoma vivax]|nr:hypothetical protein ERJ75_001776800 [Trypanosoma vivax]